MLSYQHIYHAGNLADVHKHALLAVMLDYMGQKPKPMTYLETHAGRGVYQLNEAASLKTGEAAAGIQRVADWFDADHPYSRAIATVRQRFGEAAYPGSPAVAEALLRDGDMLHLAELHPQEEAELADTMWASGAKIHARDGFEMAMAVCPPTPRRGIALIDPSYEIKTDYDTIPGFIAKLHRKWNVGVIALWYPILSDDTQASMVAALAELDVPKVLHHEVRFPPARDTHRMVGSGMFVLNAPFGLDAEAAKITRNFSTL